MRRSQGVWIICLLIITWFILLVPTTTTVLDWFVMFGRAGGGGVGHGLLSSTTSLASTMTTTTTTTTNSIRRILCFGDSLTAGTSPPLLENYPYAIHLEQALLLSYPPRSSQNRATMMIMMTIMK